MEYFENEELLQFRLVCRQWRDSILQVPVSIDISKYNPIFMEKLPSVFNIKSLKLSKTCKSYETLLQRCTKLSELNFIDGDLTGLIPCIPNPQLLQSIKAWHLKNVPFEKLVNLKQLRYVISNMKF
jgi:hypothetical protein